MLLKLVGATWCVQCKPMKAWLESKNIDFEYLDAEKDDIGGVNLQSLPTLIIMTDTGTYPISGMQAIQSFINEEVIAAQ